MTSDQQIIEEGERCKKALEDLMDAIARGASDAEKEAIADRFNASSRKLAELGGWRLP